MYPIKPVSFFIFSLLISLSEHSYAGNQETKIYTAIYSEPCGRSILTLLDAKNKTTEVLAGGKNPIHELDPSILNTTKLVVSGYFTSSIIHDHHCGSYPEFIVTYYKAKGSIDRCTLAEDWLINEMVVVYPQDLPENKLAPIDFVKNRHRLKNVDLSQCRVITKEAGCKESEFSAHSCDQQTYWCCKN